MAEVQDALFESIGAPPLPAPDGPLRTCTKCRKAKTPADFATSAASRRGGTWCKECMFDYGLWRWYRLTRADYEAMLAAQMGRCAICLEPFGDRTPHVDHDHECHHSDQSNLRYPGRHASCCRECVRGLLCQRCNHFVGYLEKRRHFLNAALRYIQGHPQPQEEGIHV